MGRVKYVIAVDKSTDEKKVKIPIMEAYRGKDGKYYSSKELADWSLLKPKYQNALFDIVGMIIYKEPIHSDKEYLENIPKHYNIAPAYKKMINELGTKYTYKWLLAFMMDSDEQEKLTWTVENKKFFSDWNESRYLGAVIENNIRYFMNKKVAEKEEQRRSEIIAAENSENYDDDIQSYVNAQSSKDVHNISQFLEDE